MNDKASRPACAHSWAKIDTIIDETGKKTYKGDGLWCWEHKIVTDEKGEVHIKCIPLKPCDDCDDRYLADIGP
jgi:hypothetical protein